MIQPGPDFQQTLNSICVQKMWSIFCFCQYSASVDNAFSEIMLTLSLGIWYLNSSEIKSVSFVIDYDILILYETLKCDWY